MLTALTTALRVFAYLLFLFLPAIGVLLATAFLTKGAYWFVVLGLPALLLNGGYLIARPNRARIGARLEAMGRIAG